MPAILLLFVREKACLRILAAPMPCTVHAFVHVWQYVHVLGAHTFVHASSLECPQGVHYGHTIWVGNCSMARSSRMLVGLCDGEVCIGCGAQVLMHLGLQQCTCRVTSTNTRTRTHAHTHTPHVTHTHLCLRCSTFTCLSNHLESLYTVFRMHMPEQLPGIPFMRCSACTCLSNYLESPLYGVPHAHA